MALATENRVAGFAFAANVRAAVTALGEKFERRSLYNQTRRELENLTDRELTELGLARVDINRIAKQAVYGN